MKKNYLFVFALLFLTNQRAVLSAQSRIPDLRQALHASSLIIMICCMNWVKNTKAEI